RFINRNTVEAGDERISARRFVIATGSSPTIPPIPGLGGVAYLTNETIFDLAERPHHLMIIGGGPVGIELAQAFRRLGSGIAVDSSLKSTNRKIYAIGDVTGGPQFTHVASYHAGLVIRTALFRLPVRASTGPIPRATFTDPELAQVGLTELEARTRYGRAV